MTLLVDLGTGDSSVLEEVSLASIGLKEREDLQRWISDHPEIVGDDLVLVTAEFDRWEIKAELAPDQVASVAFGVRARGDGDYKFLGTADSPPYRIFPAREAIPNAPALEFKAIARDLFGGEATAEFAWQRRVPKRPPQNP